MATRLPVLLGAALTTLIAADCWSTLSLGGKISFTVAGWFAFVALAGTISVLRGPIAAEAALGLILGGVLSLMLLGSRTGSLAVCMVTIGLASLAPRLVRFVTHDHPHGLHGRVSST